MVNRFFTRMLGVLTVALLALCIPATAVAQVTTSSIGGAVTDDKGAGLPQATVVATHTPSGTRYAATTDNDGKYNLPAVRVGGPYTVTVTYVGFQEKKQENIYTALGTKANVNVSLAEDVIVTDVLTVTANKNDIFASNRTGAASTVNSAQLSVLPTIGARSISDFTKYNPQGNGRSFGGQDSRLNNITIDGSVFNNGFGLGSSAEAGGRTGSTAISLDAIEEIQVNVAPFDVRQSGFVGAGVNAVTRSGTNEFSGSAYYNTRNQDFVGSKAGDLPVAVTRFDETVVGARIGGPIIKNKLFFFANYERQRRTSPATPFVAAGSTTAGVATRVQKTDLDNLSSFLKTNFNYETGRYENYDFETSSDKFLVRLDYNINDFHKLNVRYSNHKSLADQPMSGSASLGNGGRSLNTNSIAYENSGYYIQDNTSSIVAELNSTFGSKVSNTFIVSFNQQNEDRAYKYSWPGASTGLFPTIDILNNNLTYIGTGFEPFTPDNKLNYNTTQVTNNFRYYMGKHTLTAGASYEYFKSNNLFVPGIQGAYVFNSLNDFYGYANAYLRNDTAAIPATPVRFQYRYSALADGSSPVQVLKVHSTSAYLQDEFQVSSKLNLTFGLRASVIAFEQTALTNNAVLGYKFLNQENGVVTDTVSVNTGVLPKTQVLWEPRLGFNYDVKGDKTLQIRGGTGLFTGRPPFVWVSNQVGNNGVLTGFIDTRARKLTDNQGRLVNIFTPDPTVFTPANPTLPSTFDLASTNPNYKFPQVWKSNIAIDYKLPFGIVASVEGLFNKNINAVLYKNLNLKPASTTATFAGPDQRPRYAGTAAANRVVSNVSNMIEMTSTNKGYNYMATVKLEKTLNKTWGGMVAYTYSRTEDLMSAGSIAAGSFTGVSQLNGPNNLPLSLSDFDLPHRVIGYASYRFGYGSNNPFGGDFVASIGFEASQRSRFSYRIAGDFNQDGITNNDLLFVPNNASDLTFVNATIAGVTYTPAQQIEAFEAFIKQDEYLSSRRGQYTERNGGLLPWVTQFDLSLVWNNALTFGTKKNKNTLQLRFDMLNFGNFVNSAWGGGYRITGAQPISFVGFAADGKTPTYRITSQTVNNTDGTSSTFPMRDTYVRSNSLGDVWSAQFGIRYIFN